MLGIHRVGVVESSWTVRGLGPYALMARRQHTLRCLEMETRVTLMMSMMMIILHIISISIIIMMPCRSKHSMIRVFPIHDTAHGCNPV